MNKSPQSKQLFAEFEITQRLGVTQMYCNKSNMHFGPTITFAFMGDLIVYIGLHRLHCLWHHIILSKEVKSFGQKCFCTLNISETDRKTSFGEIPAV